MLNDTATDSSREKPKRHPDIHTAFLKNIVKPRKASTVARFSGFQEALTTSTKNFCRAQKIIRSSAIGDQRNALQGIAEAQRPKNIFGRSIGFFDVEATFCPIPILPPAYKVIGQDAHRSTAARDFRSQLVQFAHSAALDDRAADTVVNIELLTI